MERVIRKQNYKNAFNCKKCPATDDETGCPDWWRWEEKNEKGEARIVEQCGRAAAKHFEIQRLANTHFTVDNVVATKNAIATAADKLIKLFSVPKLAEILSNAQLSTDASLPSSLRRGAPELTKSDLESASDAGREAPCDSRHFSNF